MVALGSGPVNHTRITVPLRAICARSVPNDPGITVSDVQGRSVSEASQPISDRSRQAGPVAETLTTWPGSAIGVYQAQPGAGVGTRAVPT